MNPRALIPMLNRLTRMGYLQSKVGGKNPGHIFIKDPKEISVGEVILALEGRLEMIGCDTVLGGEVAGCTAENRCTFCKRVAHYIELGRKEWHATSLYQLYQDSLPEAEKDK